MNHTMSVLEWVMLGFVIVGGINWGLVGAFEFNLISTLFGDLTILTRTVYIFIALAALYLLFWVIKKKSL